MADIPDKLGLVKDVRIYLSENPQTKDISYWDVFVLSFSKANNREEAREAYDAWWKCEKNLPDEVEEFGLKVLTGQWSIKLPKKKAVRKERP